MNYSDNKEFIAGIDQNLEWFCGKICESVPITPDGKMKVFSRMLATGWIRQSEIDLYQELTKPEDE